MYSPCCIYGRQHIELGSHVGIGAFVNILPGRDGLVHISQIANERVENVSDMLSEGQIVKVKVLEVDRQGRIRLTMKDLEMQSAAQAG